MPHCVARSPQVAAAHFHDPAGLLARRQHDIDQLKPNTQPTRPKHATIRTQITSDLSTSMRAPRSRPWLRSRYPDMSLLRHLLPAIGLLWADPSWASPVGAVWNCWYNLDQHVACVLQSAPQVRALTYDEQRQLDQSPPIHKPARQGAAGMPSMVQLLRTRPGALRGRMLMIPLHTEPYDHESVAMLAQVVMCGPELECRALYGDRPAVTLQSAADFADANDPLIVAGE